MSGAAGVRPVVPGARSGARARGASPSGRAAAQRPSATPRGKAVAQRALAPQRGRRVSASHARDASVGASASNRPAGAKRRRTPAQVLSICLAVAGVALLLAAAGIFISAQLGYREAQGVYDDLATLAPIDDTEAEGSSIPQPNFDELAAINPDVVGWIYIPGTNINYPVVQTSDNTTYLDHLFNGTANASGSIFMDCANTAPGVVDQQTVLYGHQMLDGAMFNQVNQTQDQQVFDTWQDVYYITRDATYRFRPLMTALVEDSYLEARTTNFGDDPTLADYLTGLLDRAAAQADDASERAQAATRVLTLITCSDNIIPSPSRAVMVCTLEETLA